jgi:hypothetical protein
LKRKRPLGIHRFRLADDVKVDITEIRWQSVDWIYMVQDRGYRLALVDAIMDLRVPLRCGEGNLTS